MKTALEALIETAQAEHERELLIEREKDKYRKMSAEYAQLWCNGIIQQEIESAIRNRQTSIKITLIEDDVHFTSGVYYECWKMIPSYDFDRGIWNSKARAYFGIPRREGFILHPNEILNILKEAGYNVNIIDGSIEEATSKSGKYSRNHTSRNITISWNPICV